MCKKEEISMHSQKMRLISLNLVLVMLLTMLPVQAADIVVDDDGPMYTVVLNGNGGTYEGDDTLTISYGNRPLYLEDYIFTREGYTLLGWSEKEDASALDYTRFGELYAFDIGNDTQLYAVWGEGENCALYTDAIPSADFIQLGQYYVVNSETLPAVNESGFVAWYDHINGVYYAGDTVRAGEVYRPIRVSTGNYPILLEGNGGESTFGSLLFYSTNGNYIRASYSSKGRNMLCFSKDDFILSGWENSNGDVVAISGAPLFGLCIPDSNGIITLRAHWSPAYQLTGGTKLVIDGDDMTELLDTNESSGTGWRYQSGGGVATPASLRLYANYSSGSIACDENLELGISGEVSTAQIEANGNLYFWSSNSDAELTISTDNTPAIHAERVSFWGEQAAYRIVAENAVGIDAPYVDFDSPNITITGNPAVRADAKIICGSGIGYTISEDKTMLTTYAIDQKITLNGNGGTFAGRETVVTNYDVNNKLDLSQYAFTREGFALIGWSADANGSNFVTEHDGKISGASYPELYAVWLAVPKDTGYAIFEFWGRNGERTIPDAFSSYTSSMTYCCMKITDDFIMPETISDNDRYPVVWRSVSDYSLYASGEHTTLTSGTIFKSAVSIYEKDTHIIMLDGNGGTYMTGLDNVEYCASRSVETGSYPVGATVNYARSFTRPGYTLVSYNSEPDGSGTEYALNKCTVTADMDSIQILYAQWKKIEESGQYITIDGKQYDATQDWSGNGWEYYYSNGGRITFSGYHGGSIESDVALQVSCSVGQNIVTGCISAPELNVDIYTYGDSGGESLTLHAQKGAALISQGNMEIGAQNHAGISAIGAEGHPAVSAGGELSLCFWDEGRFSAQGGNTAAISAESINNNRGNDCVITAGTSSKDAAEVDRYTGQQYVSYEVRTKTLTLHGSGGTADGKDSISVDTKDSYIDLSQYANTFSNDGKVLLGWSMTENSQTIDYSTNQGDYLAFAGEVSKDLYAVWDSNGQKGIVLNGYGGLDEYENYIYYERFVSAVNAGTQYTLPDSYKAGYRFLGWRSAQDGQLYPAGTAITVEQSMTYTAEYEVLSMTINGKSYRMDRAHGSRSLGWEYRPAFEYGRWSEQVWLDVYENYSGKPISIPSTVYITLYGNVTGESGQPAISVDGDAQIYSGASGNGQKSVVITGGAGAPAIQTSGNLNVDLDSLWDRRGVPLIVRSEMGQPALKGKKVNVHTVMLAGSSESDAVLTGRYRDESFVRVSDELLTVTLQPGQTVPSLPEAEGVVFVAWRADGRGSVWYRPGDVIEGAEVTLRAHYMWDDSGAVILDGNGGTTSSGSKYYVAQVSGADLRLTESTARNGFTRDGYTLSGYNDRADGSGRNYTFRQLADGSAWDSLVGKVLTFFAQWTRNGDPVTPEKPSKPTTPTQPTTPPQTTTPDGSADITVSGSTVKVENVDVDKLVTDNGDKKTAEIDLSGTKSGITDVTLPTDAVKEVAASEAESLTVKLPDVTVSFDDKALAAVAEQSSGADLSLSVNVGAANNSNLTDAQKNAITGARELSVIEVSLSSNGEKISNFNGGSVTIDVPFEWSMKGLLRAYYIDENGNKSAIDVTYKNGVATLVLNHFSTYVVEAVDALSFTDVSAKAYYFDAVAWAVKNKITSGQSDTLFAPDASCTRAQMVTFLWRANGSPEPTVTELPFIDVAADAYYAKAVLWAVENGITTGTSDTTFDPDGVVTRAEAVAFLWRAAGKPIAEGSLFADVESTKYYAEAVRWAVTSGITNGMSDSVFAPSSTCTRAQIVTFLYRTHRSK